MTDKFPFAFDVKSMTEAFKMPEMDGLFPKAMPAFDYTAFQDAQKKNVAAMMEANKAAMSGYQTLYKRQVELFEAAMAETKDRMGGLQGQPLTVESATENFETLKASFDKTVADLKEVGDLAQSANTDAFDIIKARADEVLAEIKVAADKMAA